MILPNSGSAAIEQVVTALQMGSDLVQADSELEIRSIAVEAKGHAWYNFATVGRVTSSPPDSSPQLVRMGTVAVTWTRVPVEEITSADALRNALAYWRRAVDASSGYAFSDSWRSDRRPTGNSWSEFPCWVLRGYEQIKDRPSYGESGPFFDVETTLFGEDLGGLAVEWLRAPWLKGQTTTQHSYDVVLPDRRARFIRYSAEGNELRFGVETAVSEDELKGAAVAELVSGVEHRQSTAVRNGEVRFEFSGSVRDLRVWLFHEDGLWLDQYYESAYGASWGPSIYNAPRELHDDAYAAVQQALNSGETESVEFKAWVDPTPGSSKAAELPRTVVAFANRGAGEIFIGIDDDGEIQDITPKLKPLYGAQCAGDHDCLVAAYMSDVRKVIAEDVTPQPQVLVEPVVIAEQQLLRIRVSRTEKGPYCLVRNGVALLRRGATNKPISAADLADLIRASQTPIP